MILISKKIIVGLGTYTPVTANLLSTPPYIVASVMTVVIAFLSDRWHTRGPLVLAVLPGQSFSIV